MNVLAQEYSAPVPAPRIRPFPTGFLFGAATAAYQIEGAAFEDGRTASIWDAFSRVPGAVINADNGDVACDHYHRYRGDVALMKELGLDTYRFSASWSRVRPDGGAVNPKGIDFYERLVDELLGADIRPWLTLYHWDLPQALEERGGWTARETSERFAEYALSVHDALGDRVTDWTTLNEPWCSSFLSYTGGIHAPGRFSIADGMLASHHLLRGHGLVVEELRRRDPALNLGITLNLTVAEAADPARPEDVDAARRIDGQFNRWFLDPIFRGSYPEDIVGDIRAVDADAVARFEAAGLPGDAPTDRAVGSPWPAGDGIHWYERGLPRTAMHWEVQPEALTVLLERVWDEYAKDAGTALFVTENGAAYDDEAVVDDGTVRVHDADRVEFLRGHLAAILDAADAGVDVRGYFYWSLMDNFEWAWGYDKRFGLIRVDYATQERTFKDSALEYRRVIAARAME